VIRLGGHGLPVPAEGDPVAFARAHRAFGYRAAYCPPVAVGDAARLAAIEAAFAAEDVVLAEIGIWRNLIAVEQDVRRANLAHARDCLAIADAVGARCAVSYIGSFAPATDYAPHPLNMGRECFDTTVETVRGIIDAVKPRRAKLALEMMQYSLPDSVDCYLDLIAAVDRPAFAAHVDPVNLVMTPRTYFDTGALVRDIFAAIVAAAGRGGKDRSSAGDGAIRLCPGERWGRGSRSRGAWIRRPCGPFGTPSTCRGR
jgi:sugar phosphate isomerase/epimerase